MISKREARKYAYGAIFLDYTENCIGDHKPSWLTVSDMHLIQDMIVKIKAELADKCDNIHISAWYDD